MNNVASPCFAAAVVGVLGVTIVDAVSGRIDACRFDRFEKPEVRVVGRGIVDLSTGTFNTHVLNETEADWVVLFCMTGVDKCEKMLPSFELVCLQQVDAANDRASPGSRRIRFGKMDCDKDGRLCREQGVRAYPGAAHYIQGRLSGNWKSAGRQGLLPWLRRSIFAGRSSTGDVNSGQRDIGSLSLADSDLRQQPQGKISRNVDQSMNFKVSIIMERLTNCLFAFGICFFIAVVVFNTRFRFMRSVDDPFSSLPTTRDGRLVLNL
jgi:hypothetical protein